VSDRPLPPAITGLFEAHLTVADLERSVTFYRDVVGLPLALNEPTRGAVFFWVPAYGKGLLGLWSLGSAPVAMSLHLAFSAGESDVHAAVERLSAAGVQPLSFFGLATDEPSVIAWMPAVAVYFRDPDGHLLELIAMLDDRPRPELGVVGWSTWSEARTKASSSTCLHGRGTARASTSTCA
jgi:lactoylglutathione lyase